MLQRIDIVIYRMLMNSGAMEGKPVCEGCTCVMPFGTVGMMQAFGLGVMRMIPRYFTYDVCRANEVFDMQVVNRPLGGFLLDKGSMCYIFMRHSLLPCRVLLLVCRSYGNQHQEHRTHINNQP